jgi:hypothetical protein
MNKWLNVICNGKSLKSLEGSYNRPNEGFLSRRYATVSHTNLLFQNTKINKYILIITGE